MSKLADVLAKGIGVMLVVTLTALIAWGCVSSIKGLFSAIVS